ncbi:MAG: hypothetical protein M3P10_07795, partial [Actinomycetota bacterium]|nr:hypothetical protein [Actinomycetota bacterium]
MSIPPGYPSIPPGYPNLPPGYPNGPSGYPQSGPSLPTGDLRTYVAVLRRRKWSAVFGLAAVIGLIALYSVRQTPLYDSTAEVLVKPLSPNQILQGVNYNFLVSMQTEEALVSSPAVADTAAELVKAKGLPPQEPGSVSVSVPDQTTFLDITYTSGDGASAQAWANAYAEAYVENRKAQTSAAFTSIRAGYQDQIDNVNKDLRDTQQELSEATGAKAKQLHQQVDSLNQQITSLQAQLANATVPSPDVAQVVSPGGLPGSPSSPDYIRNGALAMVVGLGFGIAIAFVRERLDDRISSREDLEG